MENSDLPVERKVQMSDVQDAGSIQPSFSYRNSRSLKRLRGAATIGSFSNINDHLANEHTFVKSEIDKARRE